MWETIRSDAEWKGEFHNRRKNGNLFWARDSVSGVGGANGEIIRFISIQDDVTHEYELNEQLSYRASHDAPNGLINCHVFKRRTEHLLSAVRQEKAEHVLRFLGLDQFKVVNDTCGHSAVDGLLRQLSAVLQNVVRQRDTLARLWGINLMC